MSVYTARAHIDGGRDGRATASGGAPSLLMKPPPEMGGPKDAPAEATNPEELLALGYGACFLSTLQFVARTRKVSAKAFTLDSCVELVRDGEAGFRLAVELRATMPGVDDATARELMHEAHGTCVYSKATRGNIDVSLVVNDSPV